MRLVWWCITIAVVSLMSIALSERRTLDPVQNLSLTVTAPVASGLQDAARPVDDLFRGITDRGDIVRENRELKEQVEELEKTFAEQQDAQQRVRELEEALGVKQGRPEDQLLAANVIAEDTSGLKRMIAIDRGSGDGLDEGMVVLSRKGSLVGTVARAFEDFAWVRLITDPGSTVNAQVAPGPPQPEQPPASDVVIPSTPTPAPGSTPPSATPAPTPTPAPGAHPGGSVRGVAEGDLRHGLLLDLLPPDLTLAEDSLVSTSGLGGNYPRALLIGTVESVEQRPQSLEHGARDVEVRKHEPVRQFLTLASLLRPVDEDFQVLPHQGFLLAREALFERGHSLLAGRFGPLLVAGLEVEDLGVESRNAHSPGLLGGELPEHPEEDLGVDVAPLNPLRLLRLGDGGGCGGQSDPGRHQGRHRGRSNGTACG